MHNTTVCMCVIVLGKTNTYMSIYYIDKYSVIVYEYVIIFVFCLHGRYKVYFPECKDLLKLFVCM